MLRNSTRELVLAERPRVALDWWIRARGMIANHFSAFDALIIPRCRSIHTWFMTTSLDVIFLDGEGRVLEFKPGVTPWRVVIGPPRTRTVIELPPGRLCGTRLGMDDLIVW